MDTYINSEDGEIYNTVSKKSVLIINNVELPKADVIFAPHHGRNSGKIPKDILDKTLIKDYSLSKIAISLFSIGFSSTDSDSFCLSP